MLLLRISPHLAIFSPLSPKIYHNDLSFFLFILGMLFRHLLFLFFLVLSFPQTGKTEDFLEPQQAFQLSTQLNADHQLRLDFTIAPEYYMYKERFNLRAYGEDPILIEEVNKTPLALEQGKIKYDPTFDKELEIFQHQTSFNIDLKPFLPAQAITLEINAQGCAEAGLCYPPMYYYIPLIPTSQGYEIALPKTKDQHSLIEAELEPMSFEKTTSSIDILNAADTDIAQWLQQAQLWHVLLMVFVLGLALSFTPCVLPMLPILFSLLVGTKEASKTHRFRLSLLYVLGSSIVYTALGIAAASLGAALSQWIQQAWVIGLFAIFLIIFALAMFGAYTFQLPSRFQSYLNTWLNRLPAGKMGASVLMGMISALICGPCVAAPLAGILLFISQTGDIALGGVVLFVLAWGQGVSLLLLGLGSHTLLPHAGAWMNTIKHLCGLLLLGVALWMISPFIPSLLSMLLWAGLAIGFAFIVGSFRTYTPRPNLSTLFVRGLGWGAMIWAILIIIGASFGARSVLHPLAWHNTTHTSFERIQSLHELQTILSQTEEVVLLDFYADWCISCIEMEKFTFSDPEVKTLLNKMRLLQVDVSNNTPEDRELLKAFRLFGPPAIIFFDSHGQENQGVRVIGFQDATRFKRHLEKVLKP